MSSRHKSTSKAEVCKRKSRSQSPKPAKQKQAQVVGSRDHLTHRFIEAVRSQMFHRK